MDRTDLSSAIRQEMQVLVGEALEAVAPEMLTANLATLEQRVQQVGRVILGGLIERVATAQAPGLPRPARHAPSQTHARSTSAAPAPLRLGNFAVAHPSGENGAVDIRIRLSTMRIRLSTMFEGRLTHSQRFALLL